MYKIITFGSAAWDVFLKPKEFQTIKNNKFVTGKGLCLHLGSKIDAEDIYFSSGGGATNAAATFVKQGFKTAYCGTIGNDANGQKIVEELKELGIETKFIKRTSLKHTNYSVILSTDSDRYRTLLAYRGASEVLSRKDIPWKELKAEWFYLAPLSADLIPLVEEIIDFACKNKIKVAFNPGSSQLESPKLKKLLKKIDFIFLNQKEAALITGINYNKQKEIFEKINKMCSGLVLMGSDNGITASDGEYLYKAKPSKVKIEDKTGVGDALASGFLSAYIKTNDIEYSIQFGMTNSGSCIGTRGAKQGLLSKDAKIIKQKVTKTKLC
jgi:hypothetical protein